MAGAEMAEGPMAAGEVAGWYCRWIPDPARPALEVACTRQDRRQAGIGQPVQARLRIGLGPRGDILVQHGIWVVHDPAERQRMRWGEEEFTRLDDLRAWLVEVGLPAELAEAIFSRVEQLPVPTPRSA